MVEFIGDLLDRPLEHAKVEHHPAHGAGRGAGAVLAELAGSVQVGLAGCRGAVSAEVRVGAGVGPRGHGGVVLLQTVHLDGGHDAPAVPVQVLALAVVVGEEVRTVEVRLCLESVHGASLW